MKRFLAKFINNDNSRTELRSTAKKQNPIEQLEQRLCLGSMHAGLAAWGHQATGSEATEVHLLKENLANPLQNQFNSTPPNDASHELERTDSVKTFRRSESLQSRPERSNGALDRSLTANQLSSHTFRAAINSNLSGALNHAPQFDEPQVVQPIQLATIAIPQVTTRSAAPQMESASTIVTDNQSDETARIQPAVDEVNFKHRAPTPIKWDSSLLNSIGLQIDSGGNAIGLASSDFATGSGYEAWWASADEPTVIKYDFRDVDGHSNQITETQKQIAVQTLEAWSKASDRQIVFERDSESPEHRIINIGVGDLAVGGHVSGAGAVLGLGGGQVTTDGDGLVANGLAWLDGAENWDNIVGNGNPENTVDFATVVAHEIGHTLGLGDRFGTQNNAMDGTYDGERDTDSIQGAIADGYFNRTVVSPEMAAAIELQPMVTGAPQLSATEVEQLLQRAAAASPSEDAIIAVVDRNGRILGVRVEKDVLETITDVDTLVFAIDGAVAKARTAAMFSNGDPVNGTLAPLTSRTVRFLSQSTITQREVESNPNVDNGSLAEANASTRRGPGFVAPIGVGGHFPPEVNFTPLVDLFGIEHTNRDTTRHPGLDGIKGTPDDIFYDKRFNFDEAYEGEEMGIKKTLFAPESYGSDQNSGLLDHAQSRGIATLPGGIPLFRDTEIGGSKDGVGETLVGGIGVFFPGADGYATHEQGFIPGIGQTETQRTNASRVLEAEFIAFFAAGGSNAAVAQGIEGAKFSSVVDGVAPVTDIDVPFGRLDLVGIQLDVFGPMGSRMGLEMLVDVGESLGRGDADSGLDQKVEAGGTLHRAGEIVPEGWLVKPHASADGSISAADVERIINNARTGAEHVRAAVRLPVSRPTRMVMAVTDTNGEVLGLFRMKDATTFSIDVAVAKARNVAYFADADDVKSIDLVGEKGVAYTNRTFRYLSQPRFPSGINGTEPAPFSILHDGNINRATAENNGAPAPVSAFTDTTRDANPSVLGHDAFFPNTNFRDPGDGVNPEGSMDSYHQGHDTVANQNGIVFFPGSTPIYKDGKLIGGFGVSGDGVDQDDVVTYVGATGFLPETHGVTRADQTFVRNIRLPYQKFLRNPFGGLT